MGLVARKGEDDGDDELGIQLSGDLWLEGLEGLDGRGDELRFELADWPGAGLERLRDRLELLGVVHRWEGARALVVTDPLDPVYLDRILRQVADEAGAGPGPDADPPAAPEGGAVDVEGADDAVAYDLTGWDDVNRSVLFAALEAEGIRFRLEVAGAPDGEGDELVIGEADEARVDELVDDIVDPVGEAAGPELLGELFVAADRLRNDPEDPEGRRSLIDRGAVVLESGPPFGLERRFWRSVVDDVDGLLDLLDRGPDGLDDLAVAAGALRDRLRPYV